MSNLELFEKIKHAIRIISVENIEIYEFLLRCKYLLIKKDNFRVSTNGINTICFEVSFLEKLSVFELVFCLMHETYHCILNHFDRRNNRDFKLWNIACDYYINGKLIEYKIGEPLRDDLGGFLFNARFFGMSSEAIYEVLLKEAKNWSENFDDHFENFEGSIGDGDSSSFSVTKEEEDSNPESPLRDLISGLKNQSSSKDSKDVLSRSWGIKNGTLEIFEEIVNFNDQDLLNWKNLLKGFIRSNRFRFTFNKINKKNYKDIIFQSIKFEEDAFNVHVCIDISGSILRSEVHLFLKELFVISKLEKVSKIFIYFFNTKINEKYVVDTKNPIDAKINEISENVGLGGGTCVKCIFQEIKKKSSDFLIVFSDMDFYYKNIVDQNNLIFVSTTKEKPPVGKILFFS